MFDQQMVANRIEWIGIEAGAVRRGEALVEFEIKNFEAQGLRGMNLRRIAREARGVMRRRTDQQPNSFKSGAHS